MSWHYGDMKARDACWIVDDLCNFMPDSISCDNQSESKSE